MPEASLTLPWEFIKIASSKPDSTASVLAKAEETQISRSLSAGGGGVGGGAEQGRKLGSKRGSDHVLRAGRPWKSPGLLK